MFLMEYRWRLWTSSCSFLPSTISLWNNLVIIDIPIWNYLSLSLFKNKMILELLHSTSNLFVLDTLIFFTTHKMYLSMQHEFCFATLHQNIYSPLKHELCFTQHIQFICFCNWTLFCTRHPMYLSLKYEICFTHHIQIMFLCNTNLFMDNTYLIFLDTWTILQNIKFICLCSMNYALQNTYTMLSLTHELCFAQHIQIICFCNWTLFLHNASNVFIFKIWDLFCTLYPNYLSLQHELIYEQHI